MKIRDKIRGLFHPRPPTVEKVAARAEADITREQARREAAEINRREGGPIYWDRSPPP